MGVDDGHNFRTIIERSPHPTCVSSVSKLLYVNRAMVEYLGYDADDGLVGPTLAELSDELIHPDDRARTRAAFAGLFASIDKHRVSNETVRIDEVRIRSRRDGAIRYCHMHGVIVDHDGEPALVTYLEDHTERRAAAEYVRMADRMSALGTLAAGVAHEINNPLTYVIANVDMLAAGLDRLDAVKLRDLVTDARTGLDRIRHIVRALRTFSRADDETLSSVDVVRVLEASIEMAHSHLRHRGTLVRHLQDVPPVRANAPRLGQVFLNLLLNAAQALTESRLESNQVVVDVERSGDRAVITVTDNGIGIPAANLPRVFDAFFTTKPVGVGTGLGLFVCHGIITAFGGTITIDSEVGYGTKVRVVLPLAEARREPAVPPLPREQTTRRGRVLVIDDEPLVLSAVSRVLADDHDVTALASGRAALERLRRGEHFDVVLCDLMMPGMRGDELFALLGTSQPDVAERMIFMTGGAVTELAAEFVASTSNVMVEKPFEAAELAALVKSRVDAS